VTLLRKGGRHVYLVHPIKTAGTSVTTMLSRCGWAVAWRHAGPARLANQPAHMLPDEYLPKLKQVGILPEFHMLVRHPVARIGSFYRYELRHFPKLPAYDFWLNFLLDCDDIRLTPQTKHMPPGHDCQVHRYEDGNPTAAVQAIDPTCTQRAVRVAEGIKATPGLMDLRTGTRDRLVQHMAEDFTRFGYDPDADK